MSVLLLNRRVSLLNISAINPKNKSNAFKNLQKLTVIFLPFFKLQDFFLTFTIFRNMKWDTEITEDYLCPFSTYILGCVEKENVHGINVCECHLIEVCCFFFLWRQKKITLINQTDFSFLKYYWNIYITEKIQDHKKKPQKLRQNYFLKSGFTKTRISFITNNIIIIFG